MNAVFSQQFDFVILLSMWDEIERLKFYMECRLDHVGKKKYSPTDNKQMIE